MYTIQDLYDLNPLSWFFDILSMNEKADIIVQQEYNYYVSVIVEVMHAVHTM